MAFLTSLFDQAAPPDSIIVFRALQLGDMLCAVPALRALRAACPDARITLVGLPSAREFTGRFQRYVDELVEFPGIAAFPEQPPRPQAMPAFYRRLRALQADVALQMHGSGAQSNPIVGQLGARRWGGFTDGTTAPVPGQRMAWPEGLPEPQRYLALLRYLGLPAQDDALEFPCTGQDGRDADRLLRDHGLDPARLVLMHVGARLPSRRWPLARYAEVAGALSRLGWQVALTGTEAEAPMTAELGRLSGLALPDLCGATSLGSLAALLRMSRLLVCNDTGISHMAAAVGAASVVIASGSDPVRWAPKERARHTVLAVDLPCRPCAFETCPIGHPCALAISPAQVIRQALDHLTRQTP